MKSQGSLPCAGYRVFGPQAARWNCKAGVEPAREKKRKMTKTLITIAFATVSMFAAQTPAANPPAAGSNSKPAAVKTKKHHKSSKKSAAKTSATSSPASK